MSFWEWLKSWWYISGPPLPGEEEPYVQPDPYRSPASGADAVQVQASVPEQVSKSITVASMLTGLITDIVKETAQEKIRVDESCLTDPKLREYFKATLRYVNNSLDTDSYDFVLVYPSDIGCNSEAFDSFAQILVRAVTQIGLAAQNNHSYVKFDKPEFRKVIAKIPVPKIDIDAKVRTMLSHG